MSEEALPPGDDLLTVAVVRDANGYGMKVSGDNPVYVQSVKEGGAAWRAGLRAGDRILKVDHQPVHNLTHQRVVLMIRANPTVMLTVHQNSRQKTPITAPVPVDSEKQYQLAVAKLRTLRLMLDSKEKHVKELRAEVTKVPDVRKQAEIESGELMIAKFKHEMDIIAASLPDTLSLSHLTPAPSTPKINNRKSLDKNLSPSNQNVGFLSGLPRSLSNLTGQSLRNLRQGKQKTEQPPVIQRLHSEDKRRHNNTVPLVPTTCLDNTPPPLPPRATERPKRPNVPANPLAKPKPGASYPAMNQSVPGSQNREEGFRQLKRSSQSLDGEFEGPRPNSMAMQMSYPLVHMSPPPLQTDNRTGMPIVHVRSQSSPEQLDLGVTKTGSEPVSTWSAPPPPGTPPPPYVINTTPCADPQRAIISMEEDDSPNSENSTSSGLFSNLRCVLESKARTAVLLSWLLGERREACAALLLVVTEGYRSAGAVARGTLRRWAYEIHSTFLMPDAILKFNGVDENMANEIEQVLANEYEKEELLRNVFRKARQKAKEEVTQQVAEFQLKRQLGLASLYSPPDNVLERCDTDKHQEQSVVERLLSGPLSALARDNSTPRARALLAALHTAALLLHCRAGSIAAWGEGAARDVFLQRDKPYKQRLKQLAKRHATPFIVRGHHLQLEALTSVAHCHYCDLVIWGVAPQAYVCTDCNLRVHRNCAKSVEEPCCMDSQSEQHNNRISRFMERIHNNQANQEGDKKSKKTSSTSNFLNMERSFRKMEDEPPAAVVGDNAVNNSGESRREGSSEEPLATELDLDTNDFKDNDRDSGVSSTVCATSATSRGVSRAESCRGRDAPRRDKHRNASDPNRLTASKHHNDLETGAPKAPSGSSSSSSLSSRSNESNTLHLDQQESPVEWSSEEEFEGAWAGDASTAHRKRQEVIHELIVSEGSHVRWLKVLSRVFLRPLSTQPALLPPVELKALFPNLPQVRERHTRLYAELRRIKSEAENHVVQVGPVADAMLNMLGESGYAVCLSRFCASQRVALESLRARRRKHKELHAFLTAREALPLCARLQLKDLLACVWQRLTKYQLLLEGIVKSFSPEEELESAEAAEAANKARRSLQVAKEVLHSVDTAIRTAENEHRLRTIQSKLDVRSEWEELRKLDLTKHSLRFEGELTLRTDAKRIPLLGIMVEEALVLLSREGDRFVLRPLAHQLSPLVKWDKVLFRPNAAVRNTFFLMNINGVQMHELSANTAAEYATWVKYIQEAPLAKLTELKPTSTTHQYKQNNDANSTNVSRNPSDASEKSTAQSDEQNDDELRASETTHRDGEGEGEGERGDTSDTELRRRHTNTHERTGKDVAAERETSVPCQASNASLSLDVEVVAPLCVAVAYAPPALHTADLHYSTAEQLRRVDADISAALSRKCALVSSCLCLPPQHYAHMAELAVADSLRYNDVNADLSSLDSAHPPATRREDESLHHLLLAAHAQVQQLTEALSAALQVDDSTIQCWRSGLCTNCTTAYGSQTLTPNKSRAHHAAERALSQETSVRLPGAHSLEEPTLSLEKEVSFDMLSDLEASHQGNRSCEEVTDLQKHAHFQMEAVRLASSLIPLASGLSSTLSQALATIQEDPGFRAAHLVNREAADTRRYLQRTADSQVSDELYPESEIMDQTSQDQHTNGG